MSEVSNAYGAILKGRSDLGPCLLFHDPEQEGEKHMTIHRNRTSYGFGFESEDDVAALNHHEVEIEVSDHDERLLTITSTKDQNLSVVIKVGRIGPVTAEFMMGD